MAKDYTTLRVEQAAKSAAEDAKTDDETWSDYILRCADADADVRRFVDADALAGDLAVTVDTDALADAVVAQLDDVGGADAGGSVSLDASERRRIAEEVAEVLR